MVGLLPSQTSLATLLKKSGYETCLVGKWHLGYDLKYSPNKNGFDYFFGFNAGGIDYISHKNPKGRPDLYENEKPVRQEGYLTDIWEEKAEEIIKEKHTKPFFLSIQFNAPHWPWQAPGDGAYPDTLNWHKGGSPGKYAAMVVSLDEAVGKIMMAIETAGIANNTFVIFTSDNGGEEFSDMGIYKGKKETLWEGGIREPAFMRWPGVIPANRITDQPAITMDWSRTILAAAGAKPDLLFPMDGRDLLNIYKVRKIFKRTFYWRLSQEYRQKAIRDGDWKYLQIENAEYLFNLANDPGEEHDLKEIYASKFKRLKKKYAQWERKVLKPVPLG
jgi:arylsulfatase A-like enzyme